MPYISNRRRRNIVNRMKKKIQYTFHCLFSEFVLEVFHKYREKDSVFKVMVNTELCWCSIKDILKRFREHKIEENEQNQDSVVVFDVAVSCPFFRLNYQQHLPTTFKSTQKHFQVWPNLTRI